MSVRILSGDCRALLATLPSASIQCCVTSPPYFGLRDYDAPGQIGLEPTLDAYIAELVTVFRAVRRVLRADGTLWLNLGDSYAGSWGAQGRRTTESNAPSWHSSQIANHPKLARNTGSLKAAGLKPKDLMLVPARVALALQADGWWLRSDIIWAKPNPMPESVTDRPTSAHEHIFLLAPSEDYFFDADAVREPLAAASMERLAQNIETQAGSLRANGGAKTNGLMKAVAKGNARTFRGGGAYVRGRAFDNSGDIERGSHGNEPNLLGSRNIRNVWPIATQSFSDAHFATFPPDLAERCIKAGSRRGDVVIDPFAGAGTTGLVADRLGRDAVLIEINPEYVEMTKRRIMRDAPLLASVE